VVSVKTDKDSHNRPKHLILTYVVGSAFSSLRCRVGVSFVGSQSLSCLADAEVLI
jgi:hypothetical protein